MKKIFLSGRPRSGKSSLIQASMAGFSLPVGGFAVQRLTRKGETWAFRLLDLAEEPYVTHLETDKQFEDIAIYMSSPGKWQGDARVFNRKGCTALDSLDTGCLVIMDELGIFERDALDFQASVFRILDSSLAVLGVIKDKSSPFLDTVRKHSNVSILEFPGIQAAPAIKNLVEAMR